MSEKAIKIDINKSAEATLRCLMHKARATKLVIGKYAAK